MLSFEPFNLVSSTLSVNQHSKFYHLEREKKKFYQTIILQIPQTKQALIIYRLSKLNTAWTTLPFEEFQASQIILVVLLRTGGWAVLPKLCF